MESEDKLEKTGQSGKADENNRSEHSASRRKLLRGSLVGVPVLLALKSTPVLACNCKLPSGFSSSGNLSRNGGTASTCTDPAKGPAWWPNHVDRHKRYSRTGISKDAPFNSIFTSADGRPLHSVLNSGVTFSSLVVAAYLNCEASSFVPGVGKHDIKKMWNGTYRPRFNTRVRTLLENENYLRYTMGLPLIST